MTFFRLKTHPCLEQEHPYFYKQGRPRAQLIPHIMEENPAYIYHGLRHKSWRKIHRTFSTGYATQHGGRSSVHLVRVTPHSMEEGPAYIQHGLRHTAWRKIQRTFSTGYATQHRGRSSVHLAHVNSQPQGKKKELFQENATFSPSKLVAATQKNCSQNKMTLRCNSLSAIKS